MNKKAIAILGAIFLLIVGTLGFLIYSKYLSKGSGKTAVKTEGGLNATTTPTSTPTPAPLVASNFVKLTGEQVVSPALFFDATGIDYFDRQGNLIEAILQNSNGQFIFSEKKSFPIPPKPGVSKIFWSPRTQDFITQSTGSSGDKQFSYFKHKTKNYIDLPPQVKVVDWAPNGDVENEQIYYIWVHDNKASLSMGSPDTKTYKKIAELWQTDNEIHVSPDGSQILFFETNNPGPNNVINSVSADGKVFKGLVKNGQNYGVLWSPDSQKFLFAKKDPNSGNYQLWVYNLTSGEIKNLGLFSNVEKAVWDSASVYVYAAVPGSPSGGGSELTVDSFYRIDVGTLEKKQYPSDPKIPVDGRDLLINPTGDKLFFRNAQDGGLYYLDLTQ